MAVGETVAHQEERSWGGNPEGRNGDGDPAESSRPTVPARRKTTKVCADVAIREIGASFQQFLTRVFPLTGEDAALIARARGTVIEPICPEIPRDCPEIDRV